MFYNIDTVLLVLVIQIIASKQVMATGYDFSNYFYGEDGSGYDEPSTMQLFPEPELSPIGPYKPFTCFGRPCAYDQTCCHSLRRCCTTAESHLTNQGYHPPRKYPGSKTQCTNEYSQYTGIQCPPDIAHKKIFCCWEGGKCCNLVEASRLNQFNRLKKEKSDNVMTTGEVAGFVFIGVIVSGTLLTLFTRYVKIKRRRNLPQAPNASEAYINARNRYHNHDFNSTPTVEVTPMPYIHVEPIMETQEDPGGREENPPELPPPTYDEALANCPVVIENNATTEQPEPPQFQQDASMQYRARSPSRAGRQHLADNEIIEMRRLSDKTIVLTNNYEMGEIEEPESITLPKSRASDDS